MSKEINPYKQAYCEMCGKLKDRSVMNWHRIFIMNDCLLPTHPHLFTFHNLCPECLHIISCKVAKQKEEYPELWKPKIQS